jgi:hypothetical protein
MILSRYIKAAALVLLFISSAQAQEVITEFNNETVTVLNDELRKVQRGVKTWGDQEVDGIKWFLDFPEVTATNPTSSTQVANKYYVDGVWTNYSGTSTVVGWSSYNTKLIFYKKVGTTVFVQFYIEGTSNSTAVSFTLPYRMTSSTSLPMFATVRGSDQGVTNTDPACALMNNGAKIVNVYQTYAGGGWTNSGTKIVNGEFFYHTSS